MTGDREAQTPANPDHDAGAPQRHAFIYRDWHFSHSARRTPAGLYEPVVVCTGLQGRSPPTTLPNDTDEMAYGTEAEALRHGEQQAMRWVHDRTGDGQGQF